MEFFSQKNEGIKGELSKSEREIKVLQEINNRKGGVYLFDL